MDSSDPIDRVREARRRISDANDNDTQKLLNVCSLHLFIVRYGSPDPCR